MKKEYAFVIPSYNPDEQLIEIVKSIRNRDNSKIFVIDDGSNQESQHIFNELEELDAENIYLFKHATNMGKGAALKTIFNYILVNFPEIEGVVTLDSDGQHSTDDCLSILEEVKKNDRTLVLGYRHFSKEIPLKSYIGNNISRFIYKIILGKSFRDTQTGLRGLSRTFMKDCLTIKSNRFEFETEQLAKAVNNHLNIVEIPIETIYIENNKATSFRPLVDSFKIYFILFRYGLSSIVTAIVDFIVFSISLYFVTTILLANMLARTASIGVQFSLLNVFVFNTKSKITNLVLFASYVYIMGIISAYAQISATEILSISPIVAKISIEGILFFVNFAFLRLYIFTKER